MTISEQAERDAARWRTWLAVMHADPLRAQAIIWNCGGSRKKFAKAIDAAQELKERLA